MHFTDFKFAFRLASQDRLVRKIFLSWPLFANIYAIYDIYVHFEKNPDQIWCIFSEKLLGWIFGMAKNHGVLGGAKKKKNPLKKIYTGVWGSWNVDPKPQKTPAGVF